MEGIHAPHGKSEPRHAKSAIVRWRLNGAIVTRPPKTIPIPKKPPPAIPSAPIDNAWGTSYSLHGAHPCTAISGHLRFPMLWAHLKVPHRGLPRA